MDLLLQLDMLNDTHLNTPMHQAGALLFKICDKTRDLVNKWYELSSDYHNIDDSPSISKNYESFIEHRHDQSIFSLLKEGALFPAVKIIASITLYFFFIIFIVRAVSEYKDRSHL